MVIFLGSDYRGFHLKAKLKEWLKAQGHDVTDCGAVSYDLMDDYPDFAFPVAESVAKVKESFGIVLCGSGVGVAIAANKVRSVRCVMGMNKDVVIHGRMHDDCNVLSLSADHTTQEDAEELINAFLTTDFEPQDRFLRRLKKIAAKER